MVMLQFSYNLWSTFLFRVLINILQGIKHTFSETGFVMNNDKP